MAKLGLIHIPRSLRRPDLVRRLPRHANFRDRTGEKRNGCQVLGYAGILKPSFTAWLRRCDCGNLFITRSTHLNQRTAACGCRKLKHGLSHTAIYRVWREMLARCYDPRHKSYARYGGQGITICKRWRESVQRFANDIGPRPDRDHLIGRISTSGNFTPSNCRWVTRQQSLVANSRMIVVEYNGERHGLNEWAKRLGLTRQAVNHRVLKCIELGVDPAEAIATPARSPMPCACGAKDGPPETYNS